MNEAYPHDDGAARRAVIETGRRMNASGINQGTSGNVSLRNTRGFTHSDLCTVGSLASHVSDCIAQLHQLLIGGFYGVGRMLATRFHPIVQLFHGSLAARLGVQVIEHAFQVGGGSPDELKETCFGVL